MDAARRSFACLIVLASLSAGQSQSADTTLVHALELARAGSLAEADQLLADGQRSWPGDKRFPAERAGIAWREKEWSFAKRYLQQALRLDRNDDYANEFLATIYLEESNLPAALIYFNRVGKPSLSDVTFASGEPIDPLLRDRSLAVSPAQVLTIRRLEATERRLHDLQIYSAIRFDLASLPQSNYRLDIRAVPYLRNKWLGLLRGLPYQTLQAEFPNLRSQAWNIQSLVRWDANKRRAFAQFRMPYRSNPRLFVRAGADMRDEQWVAPGRFSLRRYEGFADFEWDSWWRSGMLVRRRIVQGVGNTSGWTVQWPNYFHYTLWRIPERRFTLNGGALASPGRVTNGQRFLASLLTVSTEWYPQPKDERWKLSARLLAGRIFGGPVPADEQFVLGTERDNPAEFWLRGRSATRDGRKGAAVPGSRAVLLQSDVSREIVRLPLLRVEAGPFFDAGRQHGEWRPEAGVQVRVRALGGMSWVFVFGRSFFSAPN